MTDTFALPDRDRHARHRRIAGWDTAALAETRVIVAGAGALGNEVLKGLALVGVGRILIVDRDRIEASNLVRSVLFRPHDLGRPKAEVASERLRDLLPGIAVDSVTGDVATDLGVATVRTAHVVVGCLDSVGARLALNRLCLRAGTPYLDGGLSADACQISRYGDGTDGACYACGLTPTMQRRLHASRSCAGLMREASGTPVPTTAVTAALAGAQLVDQVLALRFPAWSPMAPGTRRTQGLHPPVLVEDTLPALETCPEHGRLPELEQGPAPEALRPVDLLARPDVQRVLLPFEVAVGLECRACGTDSSVLEPLTRLSRRVAACPDCHHERWVTSVEALDNASPFLDRTLAQWGLVAGHVIGLEAPDEDSSCPATRWVACGASWFMEDARRG
ncbi:MAG: ThiF family adenylyltransferase [Candidatus Sericytochromatia bacterium]|nr:ThiF family adenylyltransferase [Candidatus Sericytochromatia bacterium]